MKRTFTRSATPLDLNRGIEWILRSGIQSVDGGFFAWFDNEEERYSFLYPEITGYAIRLLVQLYKTTRSERFLKNAISAGDWLLRIQRPAGSFYCKYFRGNRVDVLSYKDYDRTQYTFDAAICLSALMDLFKAASYVKYLRSSKKIAEWLVKFQNQDGSIAAGYHPDHGIIDAGRWSMTTGCHHLKDVIALLKLYEQLGDERYILSAKRLLEWGRKLQSKDGRFLIFPGNEETYVHAHCYAVEGLLYAAKYLGDNTLMKRAVSGARWLSKIQNNDGSIWNWYNSKEDKIKVSDATTQALRIWLILEREGPVNFYTNIEKSLRFLSRMQCSIEDERAFGGVYYGERGRKKIKHVNTGVTIFAIHASLFRKEEGNPSLIDMLI